MNHSQSVSGVDKLAVLRNFVGEPGHFWQKYITEVAPYCDASAAVLLSVPAGDTNSAESRIQCFAAWPARNPLLTHEQQLKPLAQQSLNSGVPQAGELKGEEQNLRLLALPIQLANADVSSVLILLLGESAELDNVMFRAGMVADIPQQYQKHLTLNQAKGDITQYAATLDLMVLLNDDDKFLQAAMTLCNQLTLKLNADRVSLGWQHEHGIKLQTISHSDNFDKKISAVQELENLMAEVLDQDVDITFGGEQEQQALNLAHRAYAQQQAVTAIVSLPLRRRGKVLGVMTLERQSHPFDEAEQRVLQLISELVVHRLDDLYQQDLWWGARLKNKALGWGRLMLGTEHTTAKMAAAGVTLLLMTLLLVRWDYRVDAPMILKTDNVAVLSAPFDGYIGEVNAKLGEVVAPALPLMQLEESELMLEESAAIADMSRYQREAEKYRATLALPEMRIAQALQQQASARLERIRYQLEKANVLTPFEGVVVEGDLEKVRGAAVRKGDVLFKVAQIGDTYIELKINERDVHALEVGALGEIALVSLPDLKTPIRIEQLYPVAQDDDGGSVFIARAVVEAEQPDWWRPGMTGMAKVDAGERSLLWVISHRTLEYFQMLFWS